MFCSKCGTKNDTNSTYCASCGTSIKLPPPPPPPPPPPMAGPSNKQIKSESLPFGLTPNNNKVQQQSEEQIETQVTENTHNSEALTIANQISFAFGYALFCYVKGSTFKSSDDFEYVIVGFLFFVAITYYVMVVNAVKKQKYQWALYFSIFIGIASILSSYGSMNDGEFATYNFFDWVGEAIGYIQAGLAFYVYNLIKKDVETPE